MPPPTDRIAPMLASAALATPSLLEAQRMLLSNELESFLAPLVAYCGSLAEDEHLDLAEFRRAQQIRQAIEVLLRYDATTEQLLAHYRQALSAAQHQAAQQVPSLEQALGMLPLLPPVC